MRDGEHEQAGSLPVLDRGKHCLPLTTLSHAWMPRNPPQKGTSCWNWHLKLNSCLQSNPTPYFMKEVKTPVLHDPHSSTLSLHLYFKLGWGESHLPVHEHSSLAPFPEVFPPQPRSLDSSSGHLRTRNHHMLNFRELPQLPRPRRAAEV